MDDPRIHHAAAASLDLSRRRGFARPSAAAVDILSTCTLRIQMKDMAHSKRYGSMDLLLELS